jgi:hypothetical protein
MVRDVAAAAAGDEDLGAELLGGVEGEIFGRTESPLPGTARPAVIAAIRPAAPAPMIAMSQDSGTGQLYRAIRVLRAGVPFPAPAGRA